MFDFVCNHMSAKSEWFKNYLQQHPGFEDFFIAVDPQTDLSAVTRPRALPLLTPFQMRDHSTRHLWTTFSDDQIDLNYRSPEVLLAMVDVLLCYLAKGAEGNDSNLLIVFYVQIMPDDFVMQLHRF